LNALQLRSAAAIELVTYRVMDPEVALSYVVWPSEKLRRLTDAAQTEKGSRWTREHREEARRLAAQGLSQREIARYVCGDVRQRATVQGWTRNPSCREPVVAQAVAQAA